MNDRTTNTTNEIPNAELDVLSVLWRIGSSTARQVQERLADRRPMTDGATVTLLRRLESKGLVERWKSPGASYVYSATKRAEPTCRRIVRGMVDRLFGGDGAQLLVSLFEGRTPSDAELDAIEKALDRIKKQKQS